jgi:hypothetical protein
MSNLTGMYVVFEVFRFAALTPFIVRSGKFAVLITRIESLLPGSFAVTIPLHVLFGPNCLVAVVVDVPVIAP